MLFSYKYLENHGIYKLQEWVDQIFLDVWCAADPEIEYSIDLLPEEIQEIVLEIYRDDRIKDYLYGPIETVYKLFQQLTKEQILILRGRYNSVKVIDQLCCHENGSVPFSIEDLNNDYAILKEPLLIFFQNLWKSVMHLSFIQKKLGCTINDHYSDFVNENKKGICPYCGLNYLDEADVKTRDAYDHYLPKSIYPFLSVDFKNLTPMCYKCNSGNKGNKDPLHDTRGNRRRAFYPFKSYDQFEIHISLSHKNYNSLKKEDVKIEFESSVDLPEIETWNELFDIKNRYESTCCKESVGKYWIKQVIEESRNYGLSPKEFLKRQLITAEKNKYSDTNFLRKPLLEACDEIGLFD